MVGADLTLNHPKSENGRFRRNMDGGVDEAVVGVVTEATINDKGEGLWDVGFKADVYRHELFEALESGLWLRSGYGVSIGGTGVPDKVMEAEDGRVVMTFETDFSFDHLAIVHKPAYRRATIDRVEVANVANAGEAFNSQPKPAEFSAKESDTMSEESVPIEASEEEVIETPDYESEIAALRASLAEREAEIESFKAAEAEKAEEERSALVARATELGMSGHDDLPSETLNSLIASWEASRPVEEETVLSPVVASEAVESTPEPTEGPVVANYLNRRLLQTPEAIYAKAWDAWAGAWNRTLAASEKARMGAPSFKEAREQNLI